MTRAILILSVVLGLAACGEPDAPKGRPKASPPPTPLSVAKAPAAPAGPGVAMPALVEPGLQQAAGVSQLELLPRLNAKVFSVSGGDPALNGLVTYFGLFAGADEGWRVYAIGDFNEWRVVESAPGKLVLAVRQDAASEDGSVKNSPRFIHVSFDNTGDAPPDAISVASSD